MLTTTIVITKHVNPWYNQALEEYLLTHVQPNECIMYLWQNQHTVFIGKNQNPWRECRTSELENDQGKLARRISGGGAVYHDLGNLNFTFVVDRKLYDLTRQLQVILGAVKSLGISAEFSGRNDLVVNGRKFSGNAFCFRPQSAFHHGTILINVDISKLTYYLQVSKEKIQSKGIQSIQARVTNLQEHAPNLTIQTMTTALCESFQQVYSKTSRITTYEDNFDKSFLTTLYQKYCSWEWRYGESPDFDIELSQRFPWGGIDIGIQLTNARISKAVVYSDAMDESFIEMIPQLWHGCEFVRSKMIESLSKIAIHKEEQKTMLQDIISWLNTKEF